LQRVVGTSAGALTAVCLASGRSAAQFQSDFGNLDMGSLKLKPAGFEALYPKITIDRSVLGNHAGAALQMLDQASAGAVADHLKANWNTEAFQAKLATLVPLEGSHNSGLSMTRTYWDAIDAFVQPLP
jgi:hypothetical protein